MNPSSSHVHEQLSALLDKQLSAQELVVVQKHLHDCPECEKHLQELTKIHDAVRGTPTLTPPDSFYEAVWRRIDNPVKGPVVSPWGIRIKVFSSVAAVLLVGLVTWKVQERTSIPPSIEQPIALPLAEVSKDEAVRERDLVAPARPAAAPPLAAPKQFAGLHRQEAKRKVMAQNQMLESRLSSRGDNSLAKGYGAKSVSVAPQALAGSGADVEVAVASIEEQSVPSAFVEWRGDDSQIRRFQTVAVTTPEAMRRLWAKHAPQASVPEVDFTQFMVVGVVLGPTLNKNITVEVFGTREQAGALMVYYRDVTAKLADTGAAGHIPFHFKVVPKSSLPVQFEKI